MDEPPVPAPSLASHPLWQRLQLYQIGPSDAALPFVQRLARENGWSAAHAARVIEEYRRFCFLAVTAGHPVTPSDAVDQVWHLHLTYSRDYWERFCPDVLGQPLPLLVLLLFGVIKFFIGEARERPTDYLLALLIFTAVLAALRFGALDRRTEEGHALLSAEGKRADRLRRAPTADELGLAVALFGTTVLVGHNGPRCMISAAVPAETVAETAEAATAAAATAVAVEAAAAAAAKA